MKKIVSLALIAALLCSSCGGADNISSSESSTTLPVSEPPVSSTDSQTHPTTKYAEKTTSASSEKITASETIVSSVTETVETYTETSVEISSDASSETVAEITEISTSSETSTTSAEPVITCDTTTTAAEIITETEPPAAQMPPAEIHARKVESPGKHIEKTETAVIDYSNANLGYISAAYSGKSARAKLRIVCNDITTDHDLAVNGEPEYFPLMQGSGDYRIQIYEQLEGKMYSPVAELNAKLTVNNEIEMYLYPNRYSMFDKNSQCVKLSAELCGGKDDAIEKIAAIFKYITDNVTYDYDLAANVKSGYIPDPDSVLKKKSGICFDYASLFVAMARSQNIPARLVIGYADPDIYHAWNEVYTEETGWITPELLLSQKGYNIVDATFYAGAKDKDSIAEYISDKGNYSSVYKY